MKPFVYYGQNREDLILWAFFKDQEKGFYVDVGAHHPVDDSVTKLFYLKGWRGINVEPQIEQFKLLNNDRKEDINLNIGISDSPGELKLRSYESSGLSTFSEVQKDELSGRIDDPGTSRYKEYSVKVDTLKNIFKKHKVKKIHFMKVDVEGYEYNVLKGNDWSVFRPEVLCIEADHVHKDWRPILEASNYVFAFFDGLNEYYVSKESGHRLEMFKKNFPKLLVDSPIISNGWHKVVNKTARQLSKVQSALDKQVELREQDQKNIIDLKENLRNTESIKWLIIRLLTILKNRITRHLGKSK